MSRPSLEQVWEWLDAIPDPEIPVISLVDLGIIRNVEWNDDTLVVSVTPTYSGCPATSFINMEIETALRGHGIEKLELKRQLSPAWTTDWLSSKGTAKLEEYGIAPPVEGSADKRVLFAEPPVVKCPRCKSKNTHMVSMHGSTACKSAYTCKDCLEPFEYFKCL